jgi:site-specific DNA-methyltransferase (adenine-specific)
LRDYQVHGQLGLEETPEEYVKNMVQVFREVRRVLRDDGTLWLNLGDSYATNGVYIKSWTERHPEKTHLHTKNSERYGRDKKGFRGGEYSIKGKDLVGIPWRVAFALQADGWYLRQDIIWSKPNPMPESITDRCTKAHEYIFLLSKNKKYYYDNEAIKEDAKTLPTTRNKRSVWTVTTKPFKGAHFAVFPEKLIEPCVLAGCPANGVVLDPFLGSGTTAMVAKQFNRRYVGIELNPEYLAIAQRRVAGVQLDMLRTQI